MRNPVEITPAYLRTRPLPGDVAESDKDAHGKVLVVGAEPELAGATILTAMAALRVGAGKLQIAAPADYAVQLALRMPEARVVEGQDRAVELAPHSDALIIGPGLMDEQRAASLTLRLLDAAPRTAFLIDAAAMTGLRLSPGAAALCNGRAVLTPHAGEMAKLMDLEEDEVKRRAPQVAAACAARFHAVVALKGSETHIASPGGEVWRNSCGVAGLGVSGSGDVLAGVIGGLLARGADPATAANWGVYLHAQAGRRLSSTVGPRGFLARELLGALPPELLAAEAA